MDKLDRLVDKVTRKHEGVHQKAKTEDSGLANHGKELWWRRQERGVTG